MAVQKSHRYTRNGAAIREARRTLRPHISQENFAALIGTTRRHMIRLENGENLPGATLRDRIVEATGVAPDAIRSADDEEEDELLSALLKVIVERKPALLAGLFKQAAA